MKTAIYYLDQIMSAINHQEVIYAIEDGFKLMKNNNVIIAPLSSLKISNKGIAKIKYGYINNNEFYVIKVGSLFPHNKDIGLQTINASMQLYKQSTGEFEALLLDNGYLTNARTAALVALIVKKFSSPEHRSIGIIGTGAQSRLILEYLTHVSTIKTGMIFNRSNSDNYIKYAQNIGYKFSTASTIDELANSCDIIILATFSEKFILSSQHIDKAKLIISLGADTENKQEISPCLLQKADYIITDSKQQAMQLGNILHAINDSAINSDKILELSDMLEQNEQFNNSISIFNLTGIAIQDIQIACLVYNKLRKYA